MNGLYGGSPVPCRWNFSVVKNWALGYWIFILYNANLLADRLKIECLENTRWAAACHQQLALGMLLQTAHVIFKLPRVLCIQSGGYSWLRQSPSTRNYFLEGPRNFVSAQDNVNLRIFKVALRKLLWLAVGPPSGISFVSPLAWVPARMDADRRLHTPLIVDCSVSSLETGGLHHEPSTQSLGGTNIRMATACKRVGKKTNTWVTKIEEFAVETVRQLANCSIPQPCFVGAINAWHSHICACP